VAQTLNQKIKTYVLDRLESGEWQAGERIPSEADLCALFDASRMTVNRAVRELTEIGVLRRHQGRGTYVADPVATAPLFEIRSVKDEIKQRGQRHGCRVLCAKRVAMTESDVRRTGLEPGDQYFLKAVHFADGEPLQIEERYVSMTAAPGFIFQDFGAVTASEYLLQHVPYTDVIHTVQAIAACDEAGALLGLPIAAPCLRLTRKTLFDDRVITHVELTHPGTKFSLSGRFAGSVARSQVA
jgi:GntR family histidine utilization transcriptional repressor